MERTLLTGATGTLGRALRPRLVEAGHDVRAASRSPPGTSADNTGDAAETTAESVETVSESVEWVELDLADGTGIESAVEGVDVVVHAATAPQGDSKVVDVSGTERLLDAAAAAGVSNFVYPSIVGIDEIPFSYYEHKLAAERAIEEADVPATILRATQFHEFVDDLLGMVSRLPVWPVARGFRVQPVAAAEVADRLVDLATPTASGRVSPMGGPAVLKSGDLARAYRAARGTWRPIVGVPLPGGTARAFRAGKATCPDRAVGDETWEAWLATRYSERSAADSGAIPS